MNLGGAFTDVIKCAGEPYVVVVEIVGRVSSGARPFILPVGRGRLRAAPGARPGLHDEEAGRGEAQAKGGGVGAQGADGER